ncbi:MAG: hypothetical protein LBL15_00120 [Oscillospiraceae bacterium]|jgi:hypothetical protein|nr:hypothetical protein [Oscillospiraceae bacterium]
MKKRILQMFALLLFGVSCLAGCNVGHGISAPAPQPSVNSAPVSTQEPEAATAAVPDPYAAYAPSKDAAIEYLRNRYADSRNIIYVYTDFASALNHFTQKAKIGGGNTSYIKDMQENWREDYYAGHSAIRCEVRTRGNSWGGWLFVNGYLPKGEKLPRLCFGEINGTGVNLSGARTLRFAAKGEKGGEVVEFFTAGLGYDGERDTPITPYPDSSIKRSLGFITLTDTWQEYEIDVSSADMSYIGCGFGFVLSGNYSGAADTVFFMDEIRFEGNFMNSEVNTRLIQSYETNRAKNPDHRYIENAAFVYDNALAALAFLSEGDQTGAAQILDAFLYAAENDRFEPGRIRNAYVYGDIAPFSGWESGARLPGWYDTEDKVFYEDQYQVGSATGNVSYAAIALLQYDRIYGSDAYLRLAARLMDRVIEECGDEAPGFTAGFDGWPEEGAEIRFSYKSIEHNIDAYAAFASLYAVTGKKKYNDAAQSAKDFIFSMYDAEAGYFYTGTADDGVTPSKDNIVLDAQVWSALALGEDFIPYMGAIDRAKAMQTSEGGYPFHEANTNGGWWPEGTAFAALTYRILGQDEAAQTALDALKNLQLSTGGFPAATTDSLTTGFDLFTGEPWTYEDIPHIAPTAWYIMAVNGFNPYSFTP